MDTTQKGNAPEPAEIDVIKLAAEIGAKTAIDIMEKERQKHLSERHKKKLRNTKLLLRNFRMFKLHSENAVAELQDIDEDTYQVFEEMMMSSEKVSNNNLFVESIKKSVARTRIIVTHVVDMLKLYEIYCEQSGKPEDTRRFRVISAMYVDEEALSVSQIAEVEGIDERTVYKDIDAAVDKLSALIFGIDGVKCK